MAQLNLNVTPEFERDLSAFMKERGLTHKSEAIRVAVREAVSRRDGASETEFDRLLGAGLKAPLNSKPRFKSEDDLWS